MYKALASLALGLVVGALYAVLQVRSPAPPFIALVGLLGMWLGESSTDWVRARLGATHAPDSQSQLSNRDERRRPVNPCAR